MKDRVPGLLVQEFVQALACCLLGLGLIAYLDGYMPRIIKLSILWAGLALLVGGVLSLLLRFRTLALCRKAAADAGPAPELPEPSPPAAPRQDVCPACGAVRSGAERKD